jgi:hypothetical protein
MCAAPGHLATGMLEVFQVANSGAAKISSK